MNESTVKAFSYHEGREGKKTFEATLRGTLRNFAFKNSFMSLVVTDLFAG